MIMKIYLANYEPNRVGGGWSFCRNLAKALGDDFTTNYEEADIYLVASPTMAQRDEVEKAKSEGKKIVLRLDNVVRNSRNRNTGMSRMRDFAEMAEVVIYQSQWARDYLMPFTKKFGVVIINSTDLDVFHRPSTFKLDHDNNYLYSRFNRDETKNWEVARYYFSQIHLDNPNAVLNIVGQFSPELIEGNFDFYNGENINYKGVLSYMELAELYRKNKYFIYTYFNDACSNSLIEALVSGCTIKGDSYYRNTGGAKEIIDLFKKYGSDYFGLERMANEYREALK